MYLPQVRQLPKVGGDDHRHICYNASYVNAGVQVTSLLDAVRVASDIQVQVWLEGSNYPVSKDQLQNALGMDDIDSDNWMMKLMTVSQMMIKWDGERTVDSVVIYLNKNLTWDTDTEWEYIYRIFFLLQQL